MVGHRLREILARDARGHRGLEFARALVHEFLEPVAMALQLGGGALARDVVEDAQHGGPAVPVGARCGDGQVAHAPVGQFDAVLAVVLIDVPRDDGIGGFGRAMALFVDQQRGRIDADECLRLSTEHPGRARIDIGDALILQDGDPGSNVLDHLAKIRFLGRAAIRFTHLLDTPEPPDPGIDSLAAPCPGQQRASSLRWSRRVKPYDPHLERILQVDLTLAWQPNAQRSHGSPLQQFVSSIWLLHPPRFQASRRSR